MVLSLVSGSCAASYHSDHLLNVMITYEEGEYDIGSEVSFTVHVFQSCEYVDADIVNVTTGSKHPWEDINTTRDLEVQRTDTGLYEGTFIIRETDVSYVGDPVPISAYVEKGSIHAYGGISVGLVEPFELKVVPYLEDGGHYLRPGENRNLTWQTLVRDKLVDSNFSVSLYDGAEIREIETERIGKGRYRCTAKAWPGSGGAFVRVIAEAEHTTAAGRFMEGSLAIELETSTMHIWAKRLWVSDENATFDLHISDWTGRSLGGADIDLRYGYSRASDDWGSTKYGSVQVTSDAKGIARVDMTFDDIRDTEYDVLVEGTVTSGETEQRLAYRLFVRDPPPREWKPDEHGLDVDDDGQPLEFNKVETWTGRAYMDAEPMASSWIHCYLASDHHVMACENVTMDAEGVFSLQFETPEEGQGPGGYGDAFYFTPAKEGEDHAYEKLEGGLQLGEPRYPPSRLENLDEYLRKYLSEDLSPVMDEPGSGRTLGISMEHPDVGPGWMTRVYMGFDTDDWDERVPEWTYWTKNPVSSSSIKYGGGLLYDVFRFGDGVWRTEVVLPENVPSDDLFIWVEMTDVWVPNKGMSVYLDMDGQGQDDGQRTDGTWWRNVVILVLIVIAVAAAVVMTLRSGRKKDPVET